MCGKCDGAMRYDESTNTIYYRKNGQWTPLPGDALPDDSIPTLDPDESPVAGNVCWKALAVWGVLERTGDVVLNEAVGSSWAIGALNGVENNYAGVDVKSIELWNLYIRMFSTLSGSEIDALKATWESEKAFLKEAFVCAMLNKMSNQGILTDDEITQVRDFDWNQTDDFQAFLEDLGDVPASTWLKQQARIFVQDAKGVCNCAGLSINPGGDQIGDWAHVFDFTTNSALGFTPYPRQIEAGNMTAPTPSADGLRATVTDYSGSPVVRRGVYVRKALIGGDNTTRIISAQAEYGGVVDSTESNVPVGERGLQVAFTAADGTHLEAQGGNGGVTIPSGSSLFGYSDNLRVAAGNYLKVYFQVGQRNTSDTSVDGDGYLRKLTIKGKGTNPFA